MAPQEIFFRLLRIVRRRLASWFTLVVAPYRPIRSWHDLRDTWSDKKFLSAGTLVLNILLTDSSWLHSTLAADRPCCGLCCIWIIAYLP